jgi:hypothetical protein
MDAELIEGLFRLTWTFQGISIAIIVFFYKFSIGKLDKLMGRAIAEEARRAEVFRKIQEEYERLKPERVDDLLLRLTVAEDQENTRRRELHDILLTLSDHTGQLRKLEKDLRSIPLIYPHVQSNDKAK